MKDSYFGTPTDVLTYLPEGLQIKIESPSAADCTNKLIVQQVLKPKSQALKPTLVLLAASDACLMAANTALYC